MRKVRKTGKRFMKRRKTGHDRRRRALRKVWSGHPTLPYQPYPNLP